MVRRRDQQVEEVAGARLRRISNAKVRIWRGSAPPGRGQLEPQQNQGITSHSCPTWGPLCSPSVFTFQAPEQGFKVSLSSWRLPLGLQPSLRPSLQEPDQLGCSQDSLNPGKRTGGKRGPENCWNLRARGLLEMFRFLCLCTVGQTEAKPGDLLKSPSGAQPRGPTAWTSTLVVCSSGRGVTTHSQPSKLQAHLGLSSLGR